MRAARAITRKLGTQSAAVVARKMAPTRLLSLTLPVLGVTLFSLALLPVLGGGTWGVIAMMLVFMTCAGACSPCLGVLGLTDHGDTAGTAVSLLGATNFILAASPRLSSGPRRRLLRPARAREGSAMTLATALLWALIILRFEPFPA